VNKPAVKNQLNFVDMFIIRNKIYTFSVI